MEFLEGTSIRDSVVFRTLDGAVANPTGVTYKYRIGAGSIVTFTYGTDSELVRDSTGHYHVDRSLTVGGWHRRWNGTGAVVAAEDASWTVTASRL